MQIIVTTFLDELYELLAQVPKLATMYEMKDILYISSLKTWLEKSEVVLEKNRRPQIGEIAGIRLLLFSASKGIYDKNQVNIPVDGFPRKVFHAFAGILLNNAQNVLLNLYNVNQSYKEEAVKYMRQILLISLQKETFYPIWNSSSGFSDRLNLLWQSFVADKDLVQGTRQILAEVNYVDALRIMDEIITDLKL